MKVHIDRTQPGKYRIVVSGRKHRDHVEAGQGERAGDVHTLAAWFR